MRNFPTAIIVLTFEACAQMVFGVLFFDTFLYENVCVLIHI